jgi:ribose transport system substrate-binding protein
MKQISGSKKLFSMVLCLLLIVSLMAGCGTKEEVNEETTVAETSTATEEEAKEEVKEEVKEDVEPTEPVKMVWYASAPHPYFEEVVKGVEKFESEFGIEVLKQIGPDWTQASQNENMEALAAQGYKYYSVYPSDASGANGLYEELTDRGNVIINFGSSTLLPTTASFTVSTDVKGAAMAATEALIQMMGGKGKIVNVLEVLEDANTVLRKEGVEEVVAKYPDVEIVQEISGMKSVDEAIVKIENAISANINDIDGIIATGFTTSVGIAQTLEGFYQKNPDKKIFSIGIDTDPYVMLAIENGFMDATVAQNPVGHGYLSCLLLKYMSEGYKVKEGIYYVDSGSAIVTKDNLTTYQADIDKRTEEIKATLLEDYLTKN